MELKRGQILTIRRTWREPPLPLRAEVVEVAATQATLRVTATGEVVLIHLEDLEEVDLDALGLTPRPKAVIQPPGWPSGPSEVASMAASMEERVQAAREPLEAQEEPREWGPPSGFDPDRCRLDEERRWWDD